MYDFQKVFGIEENAECYEKGSVTFSTVRVSVLTDYLIRIETQKDRKFCDYATQAVLNRKLDKVDFNVYKRADSISVETAKTRFIIAYPSGKLLKVVLNDGRIVTDFTTGNLKGTRRTLDLTAAQVKIGDGVVSKNGVAMIDDSESLLLLADGTVKPRKEILGREKNGTDVYCFAYGYDYNKAVADYYRLTGMTPLIPRFVLGNWWSRYKAYTQDEYLTLMKRFEAEKIPITVATVDMDWHWVKIADKFGKESTEFEKPKNPIRYVRGSYMIPGWTGYSWNTDLFPDYKQFLNELHDMNLKVTLNLHPAAGVAAFEDMYEEFAEYMGIDPATKQRIEFDMTDKKFIEGYFRFLHHKYEEEGVDFWWMDWQQGKKTKVEGLDPLWALNHYHSLDMARDGKRPLILSRFAGYGSHRYPLGFSGDTAVLWSALKFQPYFTATASNIGYSWWSHDIGGHLSGVRDDELYLRWVQFGVFSPILRLHSTQNEYLGKEPWKFSKSTEILTKEFLRLRHKLIPYIYTANHLTHTQGIPLMKPMYYDYPHNEEAYEVKNEYMFGSELIVAPITEKTSEKTKTATAEVWLPEGRYTDIFTGKIYKGGNIVPMSRDMSSIPVLAKSGAIIPLADDYDSNNWKNPEKMEILIYRGNGNYDLYEDDGETNAYQNGCSAVTSYCVSESENNVKFSISAVQGDVQVVPAKRSYKLSFKDIVSADSVKVIANAREKKFNAVVENGTLTVYIDSIKAKDKIEVRLEGVCVLKNSDKEELIADLLSKKQGFNTIKSIYYAGCHKNGFKGRLIKDKTLKAQVAELEALE